MINNDTIAAPSTANGMGAIGVIRLSGQDAIEVASSLFKPKKKNKQLTKVPSHTVHLGNVVNGSEVIDEALFTVFKAPNSYTGENVVEISSHGSPYIQQRIMNLVINKGARTAEPGEFTLRAYMNGKMDLSQAEAVADLISSDSKASHEVAIKQMRGGFSNEIKNLREQFVNFAALLELELDFSEEDVEFVDRKEFLNLLNQIQELVKKLIDSFAYGNVIKNGVPVAIIGKPNAGKSSLLNVLFNEEKAIVSSIAGTTRDAIEDVLNIDGVNFRFVDTAGLRDTENTIEAIGVEKAKEKIESAKIVIYLFDEKDTMLDEISADIKSFYREDLIILLVQNKLDEIADFPNNPLAVSIQENLIPKYAYHLLGLSTKDNKSISPLKKELIKQVHFLATNDSQIVTNSRHLQALQLTLENILAIKNGFEIGLTSDLIAQDIKEALKNLGSITGEIDIDQDILGTIFGKFCIGK